MSKFDVQQFDNPDVLLVCVREPVTALDLFGLFSQHMDAKVVKNIIWDFRPGVLAGLDTDALKRFAGSGRANFERRTEGNTVFVTQDMTELFIAKWYKTFVESLPYNKVRFHLSNSLDEAWSILAKQTDAARIPRSSM